MKSLYLGAAFIYLTNMYLGFSLGKKGWNVMLRPTLLTLFFVLSPAWVILWMQKRYDFHASPLQIALTFVCFFVAYLVGRRSRQL
jgi:hypothetical protein